ncbi:MAG: hypothetical protein LUF92_05135 [Clostridiales bacterium]|nr:hypothetical protein [Clostridiales bacterium]
MVNAKHKDRLFCALFGSEERKENLLSLYNALNHTSYTDTNDIQIYTIDDVIYMGMKNDVSFIISDCLSLYEHQSTFNPNMPLRGFMYFGKSYSRYISSNGLNLYSKYLVEIPTPQYYVFYNGTDTVDDHIILNLSNAFKVPAREGTFEWTAIMLNINYGKNKELMDKCQPLLECAIFIKTIREYTGQGMEIEDAVDQAVEDCIRDGVLSDYFISHKSEVIEMCITEYNEEETMTALAAEAREEGIHQGAKQGREAEGKSMRLLFSLLLKDGRIHDLQKATEDEAYCQQLKEEYDIENRE